MASSHYETHGGSRWLVVPARPYAPPLRAGRSFPYVFWTIVIVVVLLLFVRVSIRLWEYIPVRRSSGPRYLN